jgi:hypothetical protein
MRDHSPANLSEPAQEEASEASGVLDLTEHWLGALGVRFPWVVVGVLCEGRSSPFLVRRQRLQVLAGNR